MLTSVFKVQFYTACHCLSNTHTQKIPLGDKNKSNISAFQLLQLQYAMKRQTAGIKFTHRRKISIFAPQGRLIAPIHVKFDMTKGHVGLLGQTKFHANRFTGVGMRPQKYQKFPLFGKELPCRGESLDQFQKFLPAFICPIILH